jgi:hypothetical protein
MKTYIKPTVVVSPIELDYTICTASGANNISMNPGYINDIIGD